MATFYSSFFSSGLLAPHPNQHTPSTSNPSTPRQTPSNLPGSDPFLPDPDTTPTALDFSVASKHAARDPDLLPSVSLHSHSSSTSSNSTVDHNDDARPRLRRRKSSLTASTSPLAAIKSTTASRAARQSLFVARARSGSDAGSYSRMTAAGETATQTNSLMGRMRSGSLGGAAMRTARRVSRKPAPPLPAPPPTAPLPSPPSSTASTLPLSLPLPSITTTQPPVTPPSRRPLVRRAYTTDNTLSPSNTALLTPADFLSLSPSLSPSGSPSYFPTPLRTPYLTSDEDMYDLTLAGIPSSPGYEPAVERCGGRLARMQVGQDYPSPIDGEGKMFAWGREDEAMKEN